jgi:hypothetical protein
MSIIIIKHFFINITINYPKYLKNVRTTLELKMYLILKQKRAFQLNFVVLLGVVDKVRNSVAKIKLKSRG